MEETYWDRRVRRIEARAQLYATEKSKLIQKLYIEQRDKLLKDVDALYAQIQDKGADSLTRTQLYRYSRYQSIIKDARAGAQVIMTTQQRYVDEAVRAAYKSTFGMTMEELIGKGDWNHVSQNLIDAYLKTPWSGQDYNELIWKNTSKLARDLEKHIGDIIVQGKSPSELKKQLGRDYNVDYSVADRLVRTEVSAAHANASMQSYREGGIEYVQVLDAGGIACEQCIDIARDHGGIYPINDAPRVPIHPRCRCCYSPVLNDDKRIKQYYGGENAPKSSDIAPKPAENQEKGLAKASKDDILNKDIASANPRYVNKNDLLYRNAEKVKPIEGYEDVVCHGDKLGFAFRDADGKESSISVNELADILRKDPSYKGGAIRLLSCETGAEDAITAQALADEMNVNVLAPTDFLWIGSEGQMRICVDQKTAMKGISTGEWRLFKPKRRR